jgi:hypothetical protein
MMPRFMLLCKECYKNPLKSGFFYVANGNECKFVFTRLCRAECYNAAFIKKPIIIKSQLKDFREI